MSGSHVSILTSKLGLRDISHFGPPRIRVLQGSHDPQGSVTRVSAGQSRGQHFLPLPDPYPPKRVAGFQGSNQHVTGSCISADANTAPLQVQLVRTSSLYSSNLAMKIKIANVP